MCNHLINKISAFLLYKKIYGTKNRMLPLTTYFCFRSTAFKCCSQVLLLTAGTPLKYHTTED